MVAIWYPSFAIEDPVQPQIELLRRHRGQVIAFLAGRSRPAPDLPIAAVGGELPIAVDSPGSDDFSGLLQLSNRELELALGCETVATCQNLPAQSEIWNADEAT